VVGPATLSLSLAEGARPVEEAEVKIEGNMAHPGMAPVLAEAREVSPGRYESTLQLTMAGDWIVLVDARLRDGRAVHRELQVRGVRAQ
jgi:hypothetical protein